LGLDSVLGGREEQVQRRGVRADYIPPKRSLDGAPERFEVGEERAMPMVYIPPKRSLDGAPERFEVGEERAMPMVYIPPKRSLDGAPASRDTHSSQERDEWGTQSQGFAGVRAAGRRRPMRPLGPTTKGRDRAFQCWSASGVSVALGFRGCQLRPSSVEMSVPLGPTVIQVLVVGE